MLGTVSEGVFRLRGIPFAEPPLSERADARPAAPRPWTNALPCTAAKPAPLQPQFLGMGMRSAANTARDCLYLNVDAPADGPENAPVMVWLYGGGYITGDASDTLFDGGHLARRGVVVVRPNYRLGALGRNNLCHADQIAALTWVRDNIDQVGGDPSRVTLFGESAGAMSVCNLLTSPAAEGLFHRAIAQSGAGNNVATATQFATAESRWQDVLAAERSPPDANRLIELQTEFIRTQRRDLGGTAFRPWTDGVLLPQMPEQAAAARASVPLLIGHNADEHRLYMNPRRRLTRAELTATLDGRMSDAELRALRQSNLDATPLELLAAAETELRYRRPVLDYAAARSAAPDAAPTWLYRFNWRSPALRGWLRACHAIEIPFVFGNVDAPSTRKFVGPGYEALQESMQSLWVSFAHSGTLPDDWAPYPAQRELG